MQKCIGFIDPINMVVLQQRDHATTVVKEALKFNITVCVCHFVVQNFVKVTSMVSMQN